MVVISSDIPTHYHVFDGQILIFPTPASSNNVVTFNARRVAKDLVRADYTTGTITTVATSGVTTTVTGSGTTWTTAMQGRQIRIDESDLALTLSGDGVWYEIATVASATSLTLTRTYGGTAIAVADATYTIGEVGVLPEVHDSLPVFVALRSYFTSVDPNPEKATLYKEMFQEDYQTMTRDHGAKVDPVLDPGIGEHVPMNANLYVRL